MAVDLHETLLDVVMHDAGDSGRRARREVEPRRFGRHLDDEAAPLLGVGRRDGRQDEQHAEDQCGHHASARKDSTVRRRPSSNPTSGS